MSRVLDEIEKLYYECTDPNSDGFTAFERKKQLLLAKWKLERYLPKCPVCAGEEEWVEEHKCE